jgi:glycosyltransferase involved in cell wall biosynthesis
VPAVSAILITCNEASNIEAALASLAWADERIVVDSGSTDGTVERARALGARVEHREWTTYAEQKTHAGTLARNDWLFSLDADERVTPALADSIAATVQAMPEAAGFRVARVTHYLGRAIRCTDWYPDWQVRLYDRRRARWTPVSVHESVAVDGPVGTLQGELTHHAYRDLSHHLQKMDRYTTLAAQAMHTRGVRTGPLRLAALPLVAFLRNYVLRRGFTAGTAGLVVSAMNSYYVFLKFAKLWAIDRR